MIAVTEESPVSQIICGDALTILKTLPSEYVQCCITSPPYFCLRDYGVDGQIGLESSPDEYIAKLVEVFREVKRVLRQDGTLWLNIGDSYASDGVKYTGRNDTDRETPGGRGGSFRGGIRSQITRVPTRYRLRADLTPEQQAYVLSELANARSISEETQEGHS